MTIYLCVSLIVIGLLVIIGETKAALVAALIAIAGGFGYRLYSGEEVRVVVADALLCVALLPIAWWAAKQWHGLIDAPQATDSN
ncbi:MAG: hypothetical protein KGZ68_11840 [Dechloromonas sp.]|nr:hypothetical protein [Dechloromonas sp.]